MPHYSNVGRKETRILHIDETDVTAYQTLFKVPYTNTVPLLFFARYWKAFTLFQPFIGESIMLVETMVKQGESIEITAPVEATLTWVSHNVIKGFERYRFQLVLPHDNVIEQVFVKRVET